MTHSAPTQSQPRRFRDISRDHDARRAEGARERRTQAIRCIIIGLVLPIPIIAFAVTSPACAGDATLSACAWHIADWMTGADLRHQIP